MLTYDNSYYRPFTKGFIDENGDFIECLDYGEKAKGYGVGYSHPQNLRNEFNYKVGSFKEMDLALDELKFIRVLDEHDQITINIGNIITHKQMIIIKDMFKEFEGESKRIVAKVTSISRKKHKTFESFIENIDNIENTEDKDNKEFISHTQRLSQ